MSLIFSYFFLILFSTQLCFSETVDLKTLLSEGLSQSPMIKKSEAAYDEATWKKNESYQGFLPSLTGSVNYVTNKKYLLVDTKLGSTPVTIEQIIPTTMYSLTAQVPLFDGFIGTYRYLAGSKNEQAAKYDLQWNQFQIARQVTLQFYKSLAAQVLKEVSEQNLKTLRDHLKDVQALKKAGVSTSYDVLRVEVQESEAQTEVLNTSDNYELSKFKLGEILGKEKEERDLTGQLPVVNPQLPTLTKNLATESRRDLLALSEKVNSMHDLDTISSRFWAPRISAYGQYQYYNNKNDSFNDDSVFREAYQIGLNLTWNFFEGFGGVARSHQSSSQALQLEKTLQIARLKAAQDFEFWKRKLNYFNHVYSSRLSDIKRSTEAIRFAHEGRRAGTRTNSELLDAELDLFRSRAGLVTAQIGALEALINLELASGRQLFDFNEGK